MFIYRQLAFSEQILKLKAPCHDAPARSPVGMGQILSDIVSPVKCHQHWPVSSDLIQYHWIAIVEYHLWMSSMTLGLDEPAVYIAPNVVLMQFENETQDSIWIVGIFVSGLVSQTCRIAAVEDHFEVLFSIIQHSGIKHRTWRFTAWRENRGRGEEWFDRFAQGFHTLPRA